METLAHPSTDEFSLPPIVLGVDGAIIGTELNNKAESVLLIARDNADADRSIVSPAIIRSKAFQPFAFRLSEDEGICLPKLDSDYTVLHPQVVAYQELTYEEHSKALREVFGQYTELGYGDLLAQLSSTLLWLVIHTDRPSSKSSFASFLPKTSSSKKDEDAIATTQTGTTKSFDWSVGRRLYIPDHPTKHK